MHLSMRRKHLNSQAYIISSTVSSALPAVPVFSIDESNKYTLLERSITWANASYSFSSPIPCPPYNTVQETFSPPARTHKYALKIFSCLFDIKLTYAAVQLKKINPDPTLSQSYRLNSELSLIAKVLKTAVLEERDMFDCLFEVPFWFG